MPRARSLPRPPVGNTSSLPAAGPSNRSSASIKTSVGSTASPAPTPVSSLPVAGPNHQSSASVSASMGSTTAPSVSSGTIVGGTTPPGISVIGTVAPDTFHTAQTMLNHAWTYLWRLLTSLQWSYAFQAAYAMLNDTWTYLCHIGNLLGNLLLWIPWQWAIPILLTIGCILIAIVGALENFFNGAEYCCEKWYTVEWGSRHIAAHFGVPDVCDVARNRRTVSTNTDAILKHINDMADYHIGIDELNVLSHPVFRNITELSARVRDDSSQHSDHEAILYRVGGLKEAGKDVKTRLALYDKFFRHLVSSSIRLIHDLMLDADAILTTSRNSGQITTAVHNFLAPVLGSPAKEVVERFDVFLNGLLDHITTSEDQGKKLLSSLATCIGHLEYLATIFTVEEGHRALQCAKYDKQSWWSSVNKKREWPAICYTSPAIIRKQADAALSRVRHVQMQIDSMNDNYVQLVDTIVTHKVHLEMYLHSPKRYIKKPSVGEVAAELEGYRSGFNDLKAAYMTALGTVIARHDLRAVGPSDKNYPW